MERPNILKQALRHKTKEMEKFNLEHQYQLYLKRVALQESKMHPEQKKQLRQAFMGACGQMLVLLRDDLAALDEGKAVAIMQDMLNQVGNYFISQSNKNN